MTSQQGSAGPERQAPPRRIGFATSDFFEARTFIDTAYGGYLKIGNWRRSWQLSVDQIATDQVASGDVRMPADLTYQVDGQQQLVIITVLAGKVGYSNASFDERMGPGTVYAGNHQALHCTCHTHEVHARTISLPQSLMTATAAQHSRGQADGWKLTSIRSRPGSARQWRQTTRLLDDLLADPDANGAPLVIGPAARLLAAVALSIFPNTASPPPEVPDGRDAHPETLRRAIAFIEANPERDLTLAQIAASARVTPRAVQLAFRRHLDITPMAYLRRVRLDHAHHDLLNAEPGTGVTVTRIAIDWGFANPSRFAAHYRAAFGQRPSATLSGDAPS